MRIVTAHEAVAGIRSGDQVYVQPVARYRFALGFIALFRRRTGEARRW